MKILFTRNLEHETDHLSDMLIHGFRDLGHEVVDAPRIWHIYNDGQPGPNGEERVKLHGRGFTLTNILDEDTVDRTDIERKIRDQYFDIVVLSRVDFKSVYEDLIFEVYPKNKIIMFDGKDQADLVHFRDTRHFVDLGTYFKRELYFDDTRVHPISFSFPRQKIVDRTNIVKEKLFSGAKPVEGDNATKKYTFDNEVAYYSDYAASYFGETMQKGGWDCQRHYEIMASGCVPVFRGMEYCPPRTCTSLPKDLLFAVHGLIADNGVEWFTTESGLVVYKELQSQIFDHFMTNCTSRATAEYVLNTHLNQ
jgi:hypothetical protein